MKHMSAMVFACLLSVGLGFADETSPLQITAKELLEIEDENAAEFDERFTDKVVQISGKVGGVYRSKDVKDGGPSEYTVVLIQEEKDFVIVMHFNVPAKFRSQIAKYKRDQTVTLNGVCRGRMERPVGTGDFILFENCEPIEK